MKKLFQVSLLTLMLVSISISLVLAQPAAPSNLTATVRYQKITLKWNQNTEVNFLKYRIYRWVGIADSIKKIDSSITITDTMRVVTGAAVGGTAYFRVTAVDNTGAESVFSNEISAATSFPTVPIDSLQYIKPDSLAYCDAYTGALSAVDVRWTAQASPFYSFTGKNDTVEIVGIVVIPPKLISYTGVGTPSRTTQGTGGATGGYNIVLRDTAEGSGAWKYLFLRAGTGGTAVSATDTVALYNAGFASLEPGDIIRLRGYVGEFPNNYIASGSQFVPIANGFYATETMSTCVELVGHQNPPAPIQLDAATFYNGAYPSGRVKFSTGEPWEGAYVQMTNLRVSSVINTSTGTFSMLDSYNNEIAEMDASKWFTNSIGFKEFSSTYATPSIGQIVDTIRGFIMLNAGSEGPRGYRIAPIFKGDIKFGNVTPGVSTHRRNPVVLTSNDTAVITIKAFKQTGGSGLKTIKLRYSVDGGTWIDSTMKGSIADSIYTALIPKQANGAFVKYYCAVTDTIGNTTTYANAAGGSAWQDTSQGFFFYTVRDEQLTIADVQYTPFSNGLSGFLGAVVTLNGIVTADTANLNILSGGTTPWYIQNGNAPWSGIWLAGIDVMFTGVKVGDSISVTGTVQENLDGTSGQLGRVTRLGNISAVSVISSNNTLPEPVVKLTNDFAAVNGAPTAEPYEGMLVRFNNVTITERFPTFSDSSEFVVNDGSGAAMVRSEDGINMYTNWKIDPVKGKSQLLQSGNTLSYLQGIVYFSFNQYKIVPRGNNDFGVLTSVNDLRTEGIPTQFSLYQNYPNPFNPSTTIAYDIPANGVVTLKIYNILGREVMTLVNDYRTAGNYKVKFEGSNLPSGVYFARLQSASGVMTKKMLLIK